jgi:transposase
MRSRRRVSKLLLGQGIVYSGGTTPTGQHEAWLNRQKFGAAPLELAYDTPEIIASTVYIKRQLSIGPH